MTIHQASNPAIVTLNAETATLKCEGQWTLSGAVNLLQQLSVLKLPSQQLTLDGSAIERMDTAGAWVMQKCITVLKQTAPGLALQDFRDEHATLLKIAQTQSDAITQPIDKKKRSSLVNRLGAFVAHKFEECLLLIAFLGELATIFFSMLTTSRHVQWRSVIGIIESTGVKAMPITALLSFLIGIVLAYQMGLQLKVYGANIYIVNVTGMAILREFGPLITAIIVAGRTSSAYTAQIGTMKVNEEIDALFTMGLSPINRLVIPKIIGLIISLPLLTVWADCWGVVGSAIMAKMNLGISFSDFFERFDETITISTYLIGLSKAPVFAMVIAMVGCFQGFRVTGSAQSVGERTTISVVQAIFLIIIVDAIFSVIFSWQGI